MYYLLMSMKFLRVLGCRSDAIVFNFFHLIMHNVKSPLWIKQRDLAIEHFVHGYPLQWELKTVSINIPAEDYQVC